MNTDTEYRESQITLMVPDLDEAVSFYTATLGLCLARGVKFTGAIAEDPPVRIAHFAGPGGTPLYLCEQSEWR
jgi:catechol 2,3-dioxygenase-like lactoylglutathione lyase family enzyme